MSGRRSLAVTASKLSLDREREFRPLPGVAHLPSNPFQLFILRILILQILFVPHQPLGVTRVSTSEPILTFHFVNLHFQRNADTEIVSKTIRASLHLFLARRT